MKIWAFKRGNIIRMRRLVLTTDWSTIKRRIREKKNFFWLVPDSFYEKNSIKRIWRWYPVHKYCVYWTILQSYTLISYVNTCNISNNIEEEVEKIVFGRLPLFSFFLYPIPSSSSVYMMSYRRRWWVYVYFTLEPLAASVVVVLGHDLYTCI